VAKIVEKKKQYGFLISPELAAGLKALKERDGIAESEAIRRALDDYLRAKGVLKAAKRPTRQPKGRR
jgi:hypothetical protein